MKKALFPAVFLGLVLAVVSTGCNGGGNAFINSGATGTPGGGTTGSSGATGPNSTLNGKYAFNFTGSATNTGNPIFEAGSFTADGAGNITAGVEDINIVGTLVTKGKALTGTYSIGSDGRGTLNFTSVSQTFKIAIETGNHGQLIRFDSGAAGSGTFDLQTASAFSLGSLSGNYVFGWNGSDSVLNPISGIGAVTVASGSGSFTGAAELNDGGSYSQGAVSATFQAPDANGHGTASFSYGGGSAITYGYLIVSASRILLIETDGFAGTVGEVDLQSGTFTSASSISGSYAFSCNGISQGFAMVGQVVADGNGNITSSDVTENSFNSGVTMGPFLGTPSYVASNTVQGIPVNGRFTMTVTEPSNFADNFVVYLISPSQAMFMETDSDQLTFGQLVSQTGGPFSSSLLNGNYGLNFFGVDLNGVEADAVGQFAGGGTSTLTGGTIDINHEDVTPPTFPNNAISAGSYTVINNTTGHGTISFSAASSTFQPFTFHFYFVSPAEVFLIETDRQPAFQAAMGSAQSQPTIPQ